MNDSGLMSASIYVCQKNIERLNAELAAKDRLVAANDHILAAKDAEIAQLKACRDGECERIKLGAEPCEGCHVQVANDEIEKLRALVEKLADNTEDFLERVDPTDRSQWVHWLTTSRQLIDKAWEVCK